MFDKLSLPLCFVLALGLSTACQDGNNTQDSRSSSSTGDKNRNAISFADGKAGAQVVPSPNEDLAEAEGKAGVESETLTKKGSQVEEAEEPAKGSQELDGEVDENGDRGVSDGPDAEAKGKGEDLPIEGEEPIEGEGDVVAGKGKGNDDQDDEGEGKGEVGPDDEVVVVEEEEVTNGKQTVEEGKGGDETPQAIQCRLFDVLNPAEHIEGFPESIKLNLSAYVQDGDTVISADKSNFSTIIRVYHDNLHFEKSKIFSLDSKARGVRSDRFTDHFVVVYDADKESCSTNVLTGEYRRKAGGCFDLDTKIRMADGSDKKISHLLVGDKVYNPVTKKSALVSRVIEGPESDKAMYTIVVGSKNVKVTQTHPFESKFGLVAAKDLSKGMLVIGSEGTFVPVTKVVKHEINLHQKVRNLVINSGETSNEGHMVMADGVVTGDYFLQQKLIQALKNKNLKKSVLQATNP